MRNIVNIEASLLSAIIFDNELYEKGVLKSEYFILPFHRKLFNILDELYVEGKPLTDDYILTKLDKSYEHQLLEVMSANIISNTKSYVREIKEAYHKRWLQQNTSLLLSNINTNSIIESQQNLENMIQNLESNNTSDQLFEIKSTKNIVATQPCFFLETILPIQKHEITMISASGGTGKSFVGLYILSLLERNHGLKTFGYFSEDDAGTTKYRLDKLKNIHQNLADIDIVGKESRPSNFLQRDKNRNLVASEYFLKFKKQLKPYDVILLDPLIAFIFEDENSNTEARVFMNLLNEWCIKDKKTLILVHHHNKGEHGSVRGASAFIDAVRLHYVIKMKKNNDTDRFIQLEKVNHSPKHEEFKIKLFQDTLISLKEKNISRSVISMSDIL